LKRKERRKREKIKTDIAKVLNYKNKDYIKYTEYKKARRQKFAKSIIHPTVIYKYFNSWKEAVNQARSKKKKALKEVREKKSKRLQRSSNSDKLTVHDVEEIIGCPEKGCRWRKGMACLFPRCIREKGWSRDIETQ